MTYHVTQQDIDAGLPTDPMYCPVARSIKRRYAVASVKVGSHYVDIGNKEYVLPGWVKEWIRAYDCGECVNPIRFEL